MNKTIFWEINHVFCESGLHSEHTFRCHSEFVFFNIFRYFFLIMRCDYYRLSSSIVERRCGPYHSFIPNSMRMDRWLRMDGWHSEKNKHRKPPKIEIRRRSQGAGDLIGKCSSLLMASASNSEKKNKIQNNKTIAIRRNVMDSASQVATGFFFSRNYAIYSKHWLLINIYQFLYSRVRGHRRRHRCRTRVRVARAGAETEAEAGANEFHVSFFNFFLHSR